MGSNSTGFQADLLRINGLLQASITELRYRCEVYRLSLRSICKVLGNVQQEQKTRLHCLTTCRPSYQAYLLNLCQKQALDSINNVVRKASTFINGYSLVDKRLFQPPPPQPKPVCRRDNQRPDSIATITSGPELNAENSSLKPDQTQGISSATSSATSADKDRETKTVPSKTAKEGKVGKDKREKKEKCSKQKKLHKSKSSRKKSGSKTRSKSESSRKSVKMAKIKQIICNERDKEEVGETSSKSISSRDHQIIISSRQQAYNDDSESKIIEHGQREQNLSMSQYRNRSGPMERKTCTFYVNEKFPRAEEGRGVLRREQNNRGPVYGRDDQQKERSTLVRFRMAAKQIHENKNEIHGNGNKARESFAIARNRTTINQGQGVSRNHLPFSSHRPHNNFKLNSEPTERVRRIQLSRVNGNTYYASRKTPAGITTRNLT